MQKATPYQICKITKFSHHFKKIHFCSGSGYKVIKRDAAPPRNFLDDNTIAPLQRPPTVGVWWGKKIGQEEEIDSPLTESSWGYNNPQVSLEAQEIFMRRLHSSASSPTLFFLALVGIQLVLTLLSHHRIEIALWRGIQEAIPSIYSVSRISCEW